MRIAMKQLEDLERELNKTNKKLDAYIKCVNSIDDYLEYRCKDPTTKQRILEHINSLTSKLVEIAHE